jgi:DNA-binding transcriptional MerR regulator
MDLDLPDKLYFKIGEVSELIGVKPHVLRYWESEFAPVRPGKSRTQQRLYQRKDIELLLRVKDLLYRQGFTIAGAKKQLRQPAEDSEQLDLPLPVSADRQLLLELRQDLLQLRHSLS